MRPYWFLVIVPESLAGAALFSAVSVIGLAGSFMFTLGAFLDDGPFDRTTAIGSSLFFALLITYAIVAGAYVIRRSMRALHDLRPSLDCDETAFEAVLASISKTDLATTLAFAGLGLAGGAAHNFILREGAFNSTALSRLGGIVGTELVWLAVTFLVATFLRNANIFARLGEQHVKIDLLKPQALYPFGLIAVLPTLGLLGTQVLYPLLSLDGGFNATGTLPGFMITLVSLTYLFVRTTWPLHKRIVQTKQDAIDAVQDQIDQLRDRGASIAELQPHLTHRDYLEHLSEWPFKVSTLARWSLYLLIPPMTWVGAALIENVVDMMLS
jgi:uncharacterized membrane protein